MSNVDVDVDVDVDVNRRMLNVDMSKWKRRGSTKWRHTWLVSDLLTRQYENIWFYWKSEKIWSNFKIAFKQAMLNQNW